MESYEARLGDRENPQIYVQNKEQKGVYRPQGTAPTSATPSPPKTNLTKDYLCVLSTFIGLSLLATVLSESLFNVLKLDSSNKDRSQRGFNLLTTTQ